MSLVSGQKAYAEDVLAAIAVSMAPSGASGNILFNNAGAVSGVRGTFVMPPPNGTDDTAAIQAVYAAVAAAGGGKAIFQAGTYLTSGNTIPSHIWVDGQGAGITILKPVPGTTVANNAIIMGSATATGISGNSYSLFGNASPTTSQGVGEAAVSNLTIDCDKAHSSIDGLALYGWAWDLEALEIMNAATGRCCMRTEYGALPGNIATANVQGQARWCEFHDSDGDNIRFGGPNDTVFQGCNSYRSLGRNLWLTGPAGTMKWIGGHCWGSDVATGRQGPYALQVDTPSNTFIGAHFEGATAGQVWIRSNNNVFRGCAAYYNQANRSTSQAGFIIGDAGASIAPVGNIIDFWAQNLGAGAVVFNNDGGYNRIEFHGLNDIAGAYGYSGAHHVSTQVKGEVIGAPNNTTIWYEPTSFIPIATTSTPGIAAVDGTSVTISGGVLSAPGSGTFGGGTVAAAAHFTASGTAVTVDHVLNAGSLTLGAPLSPAGGGIGVDAHAAANGALPIGNGSGFALGTLTAGTGIAITNGAGTITISNTGTSTFGGGTVAAATVFTAAGVGLTVSHDMLVSGALALTSPLATNNGGLGFDGHLAPNGSVPIGNGTGFVLSTLSANAGVAIINGAGTIAIGTVPGQLPGTTTNDDASAGNIGEYQFVNTSSASAVALTNSVTANIASKVLTAGDWQVEGNVVFAGGAGATIGSCYASISDVSATLPVTPGAGALAAMFPGSTTGISPILPTGSRRVEVPFGSTGTVYLVGNCGFSGGTVVADGFLQARRAR